MTEVCQYLKNWFDKNQPKWCGDISISGGNITGGGISLKEGQYFRIIGSVLNDGVHQHPASDLRDEEFNGAVWSMAVPPHFLSLVEDITAWCEKYSGSNSVNMSPYSSESFKGYSYTKASGYGAGGSGGVSPATWQTIYAALLAPWRKI